MTQVASGTSIPRPLRALATAWNVSVSYTANDGRRQQVSRDALVSVLKALGAPLERASDAPDALRARIASTAGAMLEPVTVAWDEQPPVLTVRTAAADADREVRFRFDVEAGDPVEVGGRECAVEPIPDHRATGTGTRRYTLPRPLAHGTHTVTAEVGDRHTTATLLCAPRQASRFPWPRAWGVFAPVYALRTSPTDPLPGDLGDLDALARWASGLGARVVGTLPVLAAFLDEPFEPSPYAPVSRRFWNEVYVDPSRLPGVATGEVAAPFGPAAGRGDGALVDLRRALAGVRPVLEAAAARVDAGEMRAFAQDHPELERYARFRAAVEAHGADWSCWPKAWQTTGIPDAALDMERVQYHRYAQFAADSQLGDLAAGLSERGQALYLDFPLGTHRDGYDVWDRHDLFVREAGVGAPPDEFFSRGQNWGFPPVHPEASRADGHAYFAACVEHHLAHAGLLRIDHVMGFHRLWWVPPGHDPTDGAYVRYPAEELYACLTLASARHGAALIGENLGTVTPDVHRALRRHRLGGMHVVQFELDAGAPGGVRAPAPGSLSSLDTHDTPTFGGFWTGAAIAERVRLGLETPDAAERAVKNQAELRHRLTRSLRDAGLLAGGPDRDGDHGDGQPDAGAVMAALLELLGRSDAAIVLVALEDLWLELAAQNTPGTLAAENWRRPAAHAIDELAGMPGLVDTLRRLDAARGGS